MSAEDKLKQIINDLFDKVPNLSITLQRDKDGFLTYEIPIGSKTGTGKLYVCGGLVKLETRYNQIDEIESVEDIARIAWGWFLDYQSRGYNPSEYWVSYWIELGLIERKEKTVVEYKICP